MFANFKFDTISIIGTVINAFNLFVFIPSILYGLYLFHKHRHNDQIFYRNPFAVFLMNTIVIIALLMERIFILFSTIYVITPVPSWSIHLSFALAWDAIIYLKLVKVYYVYFQQRYSLSIASKAWKESINPEDDSDDASWYISHKNTFGNIRFLMKLALIPWITTVMIDTVVPALMGDIWVIDAFHLLGPSLPIGITISILYKTRLVNDIYHIRNELFIAVSCIGMSFVAYAIMFFYRYLNEYSADVNRLESLVYTFAMDGVAFACSILSTMYPVFLIQKSKREMFMRQAQQNVAGDLHTLNKILSQYKLFVPFMTYLVSEWCPENLLFLVELIQIKHAFQKRWNYIVPLKHLKMTINFTVNPQTTNRNKFSSESDKHFTYLFHESGSIFTKLSLSPQVISSRILTKKENEDNLCLQMNDLYEKYIKRESEYELNVSHEVRDKLKEIFEDQPQDIYDDCVECEFFNAMDKCAMTIVKLLCYSISRFVDSDEFKSISDDDLESMKDNEQNDAAFKELLNAQTTGIVNRRIIIH